MEATQCCLIPREVDLVSLSSVERTRGFSPSVEATLGFSPSVEATRGSLDAVEADLAFVGLVEGTRALGETVEATPPPTGGRQAGGCAHGFAGGHGCAVGGNAHARIPQVGTLGNSTPIVL